MITEDSSVNPILEHVRDLKRLRVYSATAPTLVDLALVREARVGPGPIFTHWGMGVRGQAAEDGASYYVNGFTELAQISLTNLQWKTLKPPQSVVTRFGVSKDGRILTVLQGKGIASKLSVSTDGAQTWSVLEAPPRVALDAHFESLSDGHAVRVIAGMLSVKLEFLKYDPAANRWIMTHEAPAGCRRLLLGAENRQRFCVTSGGSVLDYADKQWKVEFANY